MTRTDANPVGRIELGTSRTSYAGTTSNGARLAAGRAIRLAGPLGLPLFLAAAALLLLAMFGRGSLRLITFQPVARERTYRL